MNVREHKRYRIDVQGVVQGVGFRPFVKRLADRLLLPGLAFNTTEGVVIEIEAKEECSALQFVEALRAEAPPASRIESCRIARLPAGPGYDGFRIALSASYERSFTLIPADLATCAECLREIFDASERRYLYPFTNCTNCGPRYSITRGIPYDRANTTMACFPLCPQCAEEYANPADRRFHAEPIACPVCGPRLSIGVPEVRDALGKGQIVALKGLGGFQLACDAFNAGAVDTLRIRKRRSRKPFAVMMRDVDTIARYCILDETARSVLTAASAPIVLLRLRNRDDFPAGIASGLCEIGVMLPYTPLHHLLLAGPLDCLVMTSGNLSEEPIVIQNDDALRKLPILADSILTHDRDIFMRVDDSVVRVFDGAPRVVRRARGYAPHAIRLARECRDVIATGGELKNTFCLTRGRYAILSQHIGDLENIETLEFFQETLRNLQRVYGGAPVAIAHDLHPDYISTRWARARPEPQIAVQHHHAHIASCMAENGIGEKVIGVAFDGTGFGTDGQIWGGEFLICDYQGFERAAHFRYVALPGGDRAARQPFRMAAAYLYDAMGPACRDLDLPCWGAATPTQWGVLEKLIAKPGIRTSSCGRLFDAISSICGVSQDSSYEGESAMLLEAAAHTEGDDFYEIALDRASTPWVLDMRPMVSQIAREIAEGCSPGAVSRTFHESLAQTIQSVCGSIRTATEVRKVCLSGGTFQNMTLLKSTIMRLRRDGFEVYIHSQTPANDGGLSLGQAVIAAASID